MASRHYNIIVEPSYFGVNMHLTMWRSASKIAASSPTAFSEVTNCCGRISREAISLR